MIVPAQLARNKAVVRRALDEIYSTGNEAFADELIHPEFVDHDPRHGEVSGGPESVKHTVRSLHHMFGELRFDIQDEIAEGDRVAQLVLMRGRQTGEVAGHPPTGREFTVRHIYVWRIENGQILDLWASRDDLGLLEAVGAIPQQDEGRPR